MHGMEACLEMTDARSLLARNIKRCRKIMDLSQEELAERVGISTTMIGNVETLKRFPSPENLDKLALALGVPIAELFTEESAFIEALKARYEVREKLENGLMKVVDEALADLVEGSGKP